MTVLQEANGIYFNYFLCDSTNVIVLVNEANKVTPKYTYIRGWKLIENFTRKYVTEHPLRANDVEWHNNYKKILQACLENDLFSFGVQIIILR